MKYTNRADLLIAAGESIKMQEKAGIEPVFKVSMEKMNFPYITFNQNPSLYEFPLAVVEGKAVFVGDELYYGDSGLQTFIADKMFPEKWSWNPPKPKTVMVELLREEAQAICDSWTAYPRLKIATSVVSALKLALEQK